MLINNRHSLVACFHENERWALNTIQLIMIVGVESGRCRKKDDCLLLDEI